MSINNDAAKPADLPEKILHYIDGEFVASIDGDEFDVLDPVTNQTVSYTHLTLPTTR